ncbi:hypothetical protein [Rhizobium flavescens]|nr:hypothetical protein [Rhizobium flavescens]
MSSSSYTLFRRQLTEALVEKGHVVGDDVRALLGVTSGNTNPHPSGRDG